MLDYIKEEVAKKTTVELEMELQSLHMAICARLVLNYFDSSFESDIQRYLAIYNELQVRKQQQKETF